jgi:hypothetical protein
MVAPARLAADGAFHLICVAVAAGRRVIVVGTEHDMTAETAERAVVVFSVPGREPATCAGAFTIKKGPRS